MCHPVTEDVSYVYFFTCQLYSSEIVYFCSQHQPLLSFLTLILVNVDMGFIVYYNIAIELYCIAPHYNTRTAIDIAFQSNILLPKH